jgi:hypothetical protein
MLTPIRLRGAKNSNDTVAQGRRMKGRRRHDGSEHARHDEGHDGAIKESLWRTKL